MLYRGADVLLLDEPTAVLTPPEVEALFTTVHSMTAEGKAIVFISHKLGEVMAISDRVTVMRAGAVTGEVATADTNQRHLAELMVGHPVEIDTTARQHHHRRCRASAPPGCHGRTTATRRWSTTSTSRSTAARSSASPACPATVSAHSPAPSPA